MKPKRMHGISTLAVVAALYLFMLPSAFAASGTLSGTTIASTDSPGPILGSETKRIRQQERAQESRRQASYDSWFYRKYGYNPTAEQFRDWHYRSYGVYPS